MWTTQKRIGKGSKKAEEENVWMRQDGLQRGCCLHVATSVCIFCVRLESHHHNGELQCAEPPLSLSYIASSVQHLIESFFRMCTSAILFWTGQNADALEGKNCVHVFVFKTSSASSAVHADCLPLFRHGGLKWWWLRTWNTSDPKPCPVPTESAFISRDLFSEMDGWLTLERNVTLHFTK